MSNTAPRLHIDGEDDHEYLVTLAEEPHEWQIRISPELFSAPLSGTDELQVVEFTMAWLLERQPAEDLPTFIDLQDIAASSEAFIPELERRRAAGSD